ncbi:MAG: Hcp family type VI secretion system effector [Acidiferrobacterales bacterium]
MASDMFIKIEDIEGESADSEHASEIDVLAFSWGASQNGTMHTGTGGGAGKVDVQDLSFTKWVDKASPRLMLAVCNGKHMGEAVLAARKAGERPLEYFKITMKDVIVTSVSTGGSDDEDLLTETVTLNFGKVKVGYTPQKADGSGDAEVEMGWDIAANKEI